MTTTRRPVFPQPEVKVLTNEITHTLVIECPARCADSGCTSHTGHEWRESRSLPRDTSIDYARTLMERHAAQYPASGPYRLVEYVETRKRTVEVLDTTPDTRQD